MAAVGMGGTAAAGTAADMAGRTAAVRGAAAAMAGAAIEDRKHEAQNKNGVVISHNAVCKTVANILLPEFFGVADGARTHDNRNHNPSQP
jgi:hypothetical protein